MPEHTQGAAQPCFSQEDAMRIVRVAADTWAAAHAELAASPDQFGADVAKVARATLAGLIVTSDAEAT